MDKSDKLWVDQTYFIAAQNDSTTPKELQEAREFVKRVSGEETLFKVMDELDLDAICAPTDSPICTVAAMAGEQSSISQYHIVQEGFNH